MPPSECSVLGQVWWHTLKVGRITRPPFPFSIHLVPNNLAAPVVERWNGFPPRRLFSGFNRARCGTRRGQRMRRRNRFLLLRGHPSRQSPVRNRRNGESELHRAIRFFSTSQNLNSNICQCFGRHVSGGDEPCEPFVVAGPSHIRHFRKRIGRIAIDRPFQEDIS